MKLFNSIIILLCIGFITNASNDYHWNYDNKYLIDETIRETNAYLIAEYNIEQQYSKGLINYIEYKQSLLDIQYTWYYEPDPNWKLEDDNSSTMKRLCIQFNMSCPQFSSNMDNVNSTNKEHVNSNNTDIDNSTNTNNVNSSNTDNVYSEKEWLCEYLGDLNEVESRTQAEKLYHINTLYKTILFQSYDCIICPNKYYLNIAYLVNIADAMGLKLGYKLNQKYCKLV